MIAIFDLDGTIADIDDRMEIAGEIPDRNDREKFQVWLDTLQKPEHIEKDVPVHEMLVLTNLLSNDHHVVYLTGRHDGLRAVTRDWLNVHGFPTGPLHMRLQGDFRPPGIFKGEVIENLVKIYGEGGIAVDDDHADDTSEIYRKHGFIHLKVLR